MNAIQELRPCSWVNVFMADNMYWLNDRHRPVAVKTPPCYPSSHHRCILFCIFEMNPCMWRDHPPEATGRSRVFKVNFFDTFRKKLS